MKKLVKISCLIKWGLKENKRTWTVTLNYSIVFSPSLSVPSSTPFTNCFCTCMRSASVLQMKRILGQNKNIIIAIQCNYTTYCSLLEYLKDSFEIIGLIKIKYQFKHVLSVNFIWTFCELLSTITAIFCTRTIPHKGI